jgi:putative sigma-54 modulation protein
MRITIKGRHWKTDSGFRSYAEQKIEKLVRYYPHLIAAELTMTLEGYRHRAELRLSGNGLKLLGRAEDRDPIAALESVLTKQETALKRRKERFKDRKRRVRTPEPPEVLALEPPRVAVRRARPRVEVVRSRPRRRTMTEEQAVRALLKSRMPVLVFTEPGGDSVRVAYRMGEGQVGLLELE